MQKMRTTANAQDFEIGGEYNTIPKNMTISRDNSATIDNVISEQFSEDEKLILRGLSINKGLQVNKSRIRHFHEKLDVEDSLQMHAYTCQQASLLQEQDEQIEVYAKRFGVSDQRLKFLRNFVYHSEDKN